MQIDYFLCFQAVAKYRSFSKAADSLYISQSSLSKKIKALEDELGGTLFIRKNNSTVIFSPFGEYIASLINNILEDYDVLCRAADSYKLNRQKKLQIASVYNIASCGLLSPITRFETHEPNFHVETVEKDHARLRQLLNIQQVDVGFGYKELIGEVPGYKAIKLMSDPLVLIAGTEYAEKRGWGDDMSLSEAKYSNFCFPRDDVDLFSYFLQYCKSAGFTPELTLSDVRLETIRQYVKAGMRCTLQLESVATAKFYREFYRIIHLKNAPTLTLTMFVDSAREYPVKTAFVKAIMEFFDNRD